MTMGKMTRCVNYKKQFETAHPFHQNVERPFLTPSGPERYSSSMPQTPNYSGRISFR